MNEKLTFIAASAGTGKTYRLVEEVRDAIRNGEARPEGIVATTFTRAAANEMQERLAGAFHTSGLHDEALALGEGLISTVHGICFELLGRFAFEAGLSPDIRILPEGESRALLDRALDEGTDEALRQELYALATRLGERDTRTGAWSWRSDVRKIVETARTNDLAFEQLRGMGSRSAQDLLAALGPAATVDLDQLLAEEASSFLALTSSSTVKLTLKYRESVETFLHPAQATWPQWATLHGSKGPEKQFQPQAGQLASLAGRVGEHPRFRSDLARYSDLLFNLAADIGERFTNLKRDHGAADFTDLEMETLNLLRRHEGVRSILADEIDLLLVDEFQDTNPIQLALFTELGKLADRIVWVGDVKQSIYGFRDADPELVFQAAKGAGTTDSLRKSWRSTPALVELANRLFADPFHERLGLPTDQTCITPQREAPPGTLPSIEIATLSSGESFKNGNPKPLSWRKTQVIVDAVEDLLGRTDPGIVPGSPATGTHLRPATAGDLAILVRTRRAAHALADTLRSRGHDVALSGAGLLATPEASLALACLRRWLDPFDSLAAAEVIALEARIPIEDWLPDRLRHQQQRPPDKPSEPWSVPSSPALSSLEQEAHGHPVALLSPLAAFDDATQRAGVRGIIERWGPSETRSEQRLANLEQLRAIIEEYETRTSRAGLPVTFNGLFGWLEELAEEEQDLLAPDQSTDAIHVGTYHTAKGLEWPVVLLSDLDFEERGRLFELRVTQPRPGDLDLQQPLAGRELRRWISPFDSRQKHPLLERLADSPTGRLARQEQENEALRLLYVGITRARDHLVLLHEPDKDNPFPAWLGVLGSRNAAELVTGDQDLQLGATPPLAVTRTRFEWRGEQAPPAPASTLALPTVTSARTARPPALLTPSTAPPAEGARIGELLEYGPRLAWSGDLLPAGLGNAVHRIIAAEVLHPNHPERLERIAALLRSFDVDAALPPSALAAAIDRYLTFLNDRFQPTSQRVEVPFSVGRENGQRLTGLIDHVLETSEGPVIIDHKIFPGRRSDLEARALTYSGQLQLYREALASERPPRTMIHFITSGLLVPVLL